MGMAGVMVNCFESSGETTPAIEWTVILKLFYVFITGKPNKIISVSPLFGFGIVGLGICR